MTVALTFASLDAQIAEQGRRSARFAFYSSAFPDYAELRLAAEVLNPGGTRCSAAMFALVESWPTLRCANRWMTQFDEALLQKRAATVLARREWTLHDAHWRDGEE